jgi:Cu+-exporting ATPase
MYRDLVCGAEVGAETPFQAERDGRTYYFCSDDCLDEFEDYEEFYVEEALQEPFEPLE